MIINVKHYLDNPKLSSCLPQTVFDVLIKYHLRGIKEIELSDLTIINCEIEYEKRKAYDRYLTSVSNLNNKGIEYEKAGEIKKAITKYEKCIEVMCGYGDSRIAWHAPERLRILYKKMENPKELEFLETFSNYCNENHIELPEIYTKRINQLKYKVL